MSGEIDFFEIFDGGARLLIAECGRRAAERGIPPEEFTSIVVTSFVGRAFDVASIANSADKAAEMIAGHARGAASVALFGEVEGMA